MGFLIFVKVMKGMWPQRTVASGNMACDLSQAANNWSCPGPWLPRAKRSHNLALFNFDEEGGLKSDHVFTEREVQFSMGWPSLAESGGTAAAAACSKPWAGLIDVAMPSETLPATEARKLTGGSIHLPMLFAWLAYIHSHLLHREELMTHQPPPSRDARLWGIQEEAEEEQEEKAAATEERQPQPRRQLLLRSESKRFSFHSAA